MKCKVLNAMPGCSALYIAAIIMITKSRKSHKRGKVCSLYSLKGRTLKTGVKCSDHVIGNFGCQAEESELIPVSKQTFDFAFFPSSSLFFSSPLPFLPSPFFLFFFFLFLSRSKLTFTLNKPYVE